MEKALTHNCFSFFKWSRGCFFRQFHSFYFQLFTNNKIKLFLVKFSIKTIAQVNYEINHQFQFSINTTLNDPIKKNSETKRKKNQN
jgi:hypothetical protein